MDPNHPLAAEILGEPTDGDPAGNDESTAFDVGEGAPELSAALDAIFPPDDESPETETPGIPEQGETPSAPDFQAELAALRDANDRLQAERNHAFQEREKAALRDAALAWQQEEVRVHEQAAQAPDWDTARNQLVQFYQARVNGIAESAQVAINNAYAGGFVADVVKKTGLSADDEALLRSLPPQSVPAVAQALRNKNQQVEQRFAAIESEQQQQKRARQNQRGAITGVHRPSGQPRTEAPGKQIVPNGGIDHTLAILAMDQRLKQLKRGGR